MPIEYLELGKKLASYGGEFKRDDALVSRSLPIPVFLDLVRGVDVGLMLVGGMITLHFARLLTPRVALPPGDFFLCLLLATWTASAALSRAQAYSFSRLTSRVAQFHFLALALLGGAVMLFGSIALLGLGREIEIYYPLSWFGMALLLTCGLRLLVKPLAARWHRAGKLGHRIALLGTSECAAEFLNKLRHGDSDGVQITGFYEFAPSSCEPAVIGPPYGGPIRDLIRAGQNGMFDTVVVTLPFDRSPLVTEIAGLLGSLCSDLYFCPDFGADCRRPVIALGDVPLLVLAQRPLSDWQVIQKALFDRIGAAILLVVFAPAMLAVAALVRLESSGPALFRQSRIGFNNVPFTCFKFRTMYHHAADALADRQTTRNDERVTRVGHWLRRFSIDELPQLLNVLIGDMSLVGPRPHAHNTKAEGRLFAEVVAEYATRHRVKPGITGWAQVNGWRGETATIEQIDQRISHDLYYIRNWSMLLDIRILLLTALRGFTGPQAF